jgi:hypothetical protein
VLPCALDIWCCRDAADRSNCCNNSSYIIDAGKTAYLGRFINNVIPGTSTDATATVTSTVTATPSNDSNSSSTTTVVGAAVGAVLGVACLIALVGLIWMMRRLKSLKKEMQSLRSHSSASMTQQPYNLPQSADPMLHAYEVDCSNGRYEIDGTGK